jgi:hypothetical protein
MRKVYYTLDLMRLAPRNRRGRAHSAGRRAPAASRFAGTVAQAGAPGTG